MVVVYSFLSLGAVLSAMADSAAQGEATPKKQPRKTGVPEMDATFDRIRADRKAARDNLKALRKEFKKDCSTGKKSKIVRM